MLTPLDVGIGVLVLLSAVLATARGFTREILSLATWAGSAAIAAYAYFFHKDIARGYITEPMVADLVTAGGTFLVALIILHLITMRIADFVVDSKIGPLDRALGFVFGGARGILISVVGAVFLVWLLPSPAPAWVADSKAMPILQKLGDDLIAVLPPDLAKQVNDFVHKSKGDEEQSPADETAPADAAPDENNSTDGPEDDTPPAQGTST